MKEKQIKPIANLVPVLVSNTNDVLFLYSFMKHAESIISKYK
jgi:hypothetical protein